MVSKAVSAFAAVVASFILSISSAHAASLSMASPDWAIYTGSGTVTSTLESAPLIGTNVNVLNVTTLEGVNFGIMQRGVAPLPIAGARFARILARSSEPFMFYFLARATDTTQHYIQYTSGTSFKAYQSAYPYVMAPHAKFGGTGGQWAEIWLDLQRDLNVMRPGVTISQLEWLAVRGNLSIAKIELFATADLPLALGADTDGDGLTNATELSVSVTNLVRNDSDADLVGDKLEYEADASCALPNVPQLPTWQDLDGNGVSNRDAVLIKSDCAKAVMPRLQAEGWRNYSGLGSVTIDPLGQWATMSHSNVDPYDMGMFNSSLAAPYPGPRIERDQFDIRFTPTNVGEDFYLYVLVQASDAKLYYLGFPRAGTERAVADAGWVTFLETPLETFYGYDFSGPAPGGGFPVYVDLTAALQAFLPALHVKSIFWVAVRGRMTVYQASYPPEVRLPALTVSSGATFTVDAHDPALPVGTNHGTLCRLGVNACSEYLWSDATPAGSGPTFISGLTGSQVSAIAPVVPSPSELTLKLRVRQTTVRRPAGIWTEDTMQVVVRPPPTISGIVPAAVIGGDQVTISGTDFLTGGTVTIDGIAASVVSWSDSSIVAVVPEGAQPGSVDVVVAAGGDPGAPAALTVMPYIATLSPVTAPVGHAITLTGTGFGNTAPGTGGVLFGTTQASVVSWSNTSVVVTVPAVTAGQMNVVVENAGGTSAPKPFTVVDTPYVLTVTPNTGTGGNTLTVQGYGFGASQGGSKVTISGITMPVVSWSDSVIQATIPNTVTAGTRAVRVDYVYQPPGTVTNVYNSTDVPKSIPDGGTNYSVINIPTLGPIVDFDVSVNIYQSGNYIGDLKVDLRHPDATQIVLKSVYDMGYTLVTTYDSPSTPVQPLSTFFGKQAGGQWRLVLQDRYTAYGVGTINSWSISMTTAQPVVSKLSNTKPVTVQPTAASLSASMVKAGDSVTLTGTNFGVSPGSVLVGGVAASWTAWTSTGITFTAPALASGTHDVTVVAGGLESNALSLTLRPNVTAVTPAYGPVGTVMTLTGTGFGPSQGGSSVDVGGSPATVQTWSDTSITVAVPAGLAFGPQNVTVIVNSATSNAVTFNVGARIDGLSPSSGTGGDAVTISGTGFGATQGASNVTLGGIAATVTLWSETSIQVAVPDAVTGGTRPFRVNVGGFGSNSVSFVVTPTITGVSPASGSYGNSIAVSGTNFGTGSTVNLGGVAQTVQSTTFTQVDFAVTNGITPGAVTLLVTSGGQASNNGSFTVIPSAASLSPSNGTTATNFTLYGQNFGASAGTLTVGGVAATIISWGASQVVFKAPMSLDAGVHDVVLTANGQSTQAVSLTLKPAIMQVNPLGSPVGYYVTLTGSAFGGSQGASTLTLGGVALTATTWSTTSINFVVPMNAPAGSQNIVVTVAGQASNAVPYNVFLPRIDEVNPTSAVTGSTITLTGRFDAAVTIAAGSNHTCALTSYGGVKCWGDNTYGQLGNGTFTWSPTPVDVVGLTSGVTQISALNLHTCALTNTGAVKCWGYNASGQLGDGTTGTNRNVPIQVSTLTSGVASIGTGDNHTCALMVGGGVKCWGYNLYGSVGDGSSTNRPAPVNVSGLLSGASRLEVGGYVSCALVSGALKCWGYNGFGEIGDNTTSHRYTPTNVSGMASGVSDVSLGTYFSCAVKTTGAAMCWGRNNLNQLGDGTITNRWVPTTVSGLASGVTSITTGQSHACVLSSGGTKCWGRNTEGQLGDNSATTRSTPVPVVGLPAPVSALAMSGYHSCAQMNGKAVCWGYNGWGQLGTGDQVSTLKPIETRIPGVAFFGAAPARAISWSQTAVTVEVPNLAAGSYPVTVMLWGYGSNSKAFQVTSAGTIADVSPADGTAGDTITISGAGFEATQGASTVTLGGVACTVLNWYEDTITATVPATAAPGVQPLVVTVNGAPSTVAFTVLPVLASVNPQAGSDGDVLTLTGTSFGAAQGVVTVGGAPATVQSWSDSIIEVVIPGDAPAGLQPVAIAAGGQLSNAIDVDITPVVALLTPAQAAAGATVTIAGSHFGDAQGAGSVTVGGVAATITSWSMQSIDIAVPDVPAGLRDVVVTAGANASNAVPLTVVPALISLTPPNGPTGTLVTLIGTGFGASQGTNLVDVGGVTATVQTWSDNAIVIAVPAGLSYGTYDVTVVVGLVTSNAMSFNVSATLASVSPEVGSGGDSITLAGAGLGATQGVSSLTVGGVAATVTSWSDTQVIAEVPSSVAAGTHDITATVQGTSTNAVTMTVKPRVDSVNPTSVTGGDTVTIQGVNFGGASQTVTIGGVAVGVQSWTTTTITISIPATLVPGSHAVVVVVNALASNAASIQVMPELVSVNPVTAPAGATVVVVGTNLGASQAGGSIEINGVEASVVSWSATAVAVAVPAAVPAGAQSVQAIVNGNSSNVLLLDVQPLITGYTVHYAGSTSGVTLTGTSFGIAQGTSDVLWNGSAVTTSSWSDNAVTAWLPAGEPIVDAQFEIVVSAISSNTVTPVPGIVPKLFRRYPNSGTVGTTLTFVGADFGAPMGTVTIGGVNTSIVSWSPTVVQATVVAGTPKGRQSILLRNANGIAGNTLPFTQRGNDVWLSEDFAEARGSHVAVWTGTEMIVWGGYNGIYLATGARYNPATDSWVQLSNTGTPSGRSGHTAVWTGKEMVVWGGWNGSAYFGDGGRYQPSSDSWLATSPVSAPTGRYLHTAVWTGSKMIVWGGNSGGVALNNGGQYVADEDRWEAISSVNAPTTRQWHTAVWTGSQMIVWGGSCGTSCYRNTGGRYYAGSNTWAVMSTLTAPSARYLHTAVWTGSKMIVWGGTGSSSVNTGGRYDPISDTWQSTSLTFAPEARQQHSAVWTGNELIVWGGSGASNLNTGGIYLPASDAWVPTNASTAPSARKSHTAVWTGTEMIVWGGSTGEMYLDTGARFDVSADAWIATAHSGAPSARVEHTAVWTGSEMVVWGGKASFAYLNTGGKYNPVTESWVPTNSGSAPAGRYAHTAVWTGTYMVVWGGFASAVDVNTGGRYLPASDSWLSTTTAGAPSGREDHTAVWSGSQMIVWGGMNASQLFDGGRYNPAGDYWASMTILNVPSARRGHVAVWADTQMIVWGGGSNTGGKYDPVGDTWYPTSTVGAPVTRDYTTAVWTGTEMIVWGGLTGAAENTGGRYDPGLNSWTATSLVGAPSARYSHSAVWTGEEMIVWGGWPFAGGGRYDTATDSWAPTNEVGAPLGRSQHKAVWTGSEMLVWGGAASGGFRLGTLGRYVP